MLITRDQRIANRPAVEVREMMKTLYHASHSVNALAEKFELDEAEGKVLINDLVKEGLIEISTSPGSDEVVAKFEADAPDVVLWRPTISGVALAKARVGVPMSRQNAQELLDGVLSRADEVNASDDWLHWVVEILLYGSFAADADGPVGDIDLAVSLSRRYRDAEYRRLQDEMIERDGASPTSLVDLMGYAQKKVQRHLRGSSPRVDLVEIHGEDDVPPGATTKLVYRFDPPDVVD